jgi:hypothetical protein
MYTAAVSVLLVWCELSDIRWGCDGIIVNNVSVIVESMHVFLATAVKQNSRCSKVVTDHRSYIYRLYQNCYSVVLQICTRQMAEQSDAIFHLPGKSDQ